MKINNTATMKKNNFYPKTKNYIMMKNKAWIYKK